MTNVETLLESYLFPDGKAKLRYSMLTEAEKVSFNKSMVTKLFSAIKNKSLKVNYAGLEKTRGDITKYPRFEDIENSIKILNNMYNSNPDDAPIEILSCVRVLDILKKNKAGFMTAYNNKNDAVELLFVNIAAALIIGTSKLVAVTIEYIKQPTGGYKAIFKENSKTLMKDDTYFLSLNRFITMEKTGQLKRLLDMSSKLSEDYNLLMEDEIMNEGLVTDSLKAVSDVLNAAKGKEGSKDRFSLKDTWKKPMGKVALIIGGIALTIWACATIPYTIYRLRKTLSDHLLNLAYFLEEHAYEIDTTDKKGKEVQEKQLRIVEKLKAVGNMLSLDDKQAKKNAEKDQKKDEEQARKDNEPDNDSSDDDILL